MGDEEEVSASWMVGREAQRLAYKAAACRTAANIILAWG